MALTSCLFLIFLTLPIKIKSVTMLEKFNCGEDSCYDVLGVSREATKSEIAKAYRKLAKKFHPDIHRKEVDKLQAETNFKRVANAYEILKDDDSRNDYDYMLDQPSNVYFNYFYGYYRRKVVPQVDIRVVVIIAISIVSIIQYYSSWKRYDSAIDYLLTRPKFRNKALQIAKEQGMLKNIKKTRDKNRVEIREETEFVLRKVVKNHTDIKGGYAKPVITNILWLQLIFLPVTVTRYFYWYLYWIWKHNICKLPYNDEEKLYLVRKYMKLGENQFDTISDSEKQQYLNLGLWIKDKHNAWVIDKNSEQKQLLAEDSRQKVYRRYLKTHGTRRITFED